MFRLTNKGNQSRKNHKIINQTTKISDNDSKISQTTINAQVQQESLKEEQKPAEPVPVVQPEKVAVNEIKTVESEPVRMVPMDEIEKYILKMNDYLAHMKMLESRNAALEKENSRFRQENDELKNQMDQIHIKNINNPFSLKPGTITDALRKEFI